ncbi:hypothetical protein CDCA_CDCA01G0241 [Cyanidium caldarium]|uniref:Trafficking protein particle complex subunit n=1 Tax=Cyanidium caldarium TaxID=2771 RepID=A0AAV9IPT4_CYACA|nr:hypothetical protein CDCA_CDCA01G0241 [Cyanidium caldarium]
MSLDAKTPRAVDDVVQVVAVFIFNVRKQLVYQQWLGGLSEGAAPQLEQLRVSVQRGLEVVVARPYTETRASGVGSGRGSAARSSGNMATLDGGGRFLGAVYIEERRWACAFRAATGTDFVVVLSGEFRTSQERELLATVRRHYVDSVCNPFGDVGGPIQSATLTARLEESLASARMLS